MDAEKDQLFARGWLPDFIPASSREIVTRNNLDLNTSSGEFFCDSTEVEAFAQRLKPWRIGSTNAFVASDRYLLKMKSRGYEAYGYCDQKKAWIFLVNAGTGHIDYISWLEK